MSIPAHPHARGEHPHPWPRVGSSIGSSPHPWGIPQSVGIAALEQRFIPTPRGEHARVKEAASDAGGSSPHPWGTHALVQRYPPGLRFIPTPVGNTRRRGSGCCPRAVHPHTRGEHSTRSWGSSLMAGSSPHPWGTHHVARDVLLVERFIPTPVGNTLARSAAAPWSAVHPHTRGEHIGNPLHNAPPRRFIPTPVGNTMMAWLVNPSDAVHPHTRGEHCNAARAAFLASGSSPHPWGTPHMSGRTASIRGFIPTPVGNTLTVSHCFKKRKTTAKFHRAKRPSRRSWK